MSQRIRQLIFTCCLCIAALQCGCETTQSGSDKDPFAWLRSKPKQTTTTSSTSQIPSAGSKTNRLTSTENGLAIRKWVVPDDEQRIKSVLMRYAVGGMVRDDADERLRRNGFRLIQVPSDQIESLLAELGGASLDVTAWHGQVFDWRTIASHNIGNQGQPLAIDGHVRQYSTGDMRLVMRSWIVAMEDGPYVQFELIPQFHKPQRTDVNLLLGRERPKPIESYTSMAVDQLLEAGSAYLLTCAPPQSKWTISAVPSLDEPDITTQPLRRRGGASVGPSDMIGPEAAPPQTIGQWMLSTDIGQPSRIVLVLLPRISQRLFPPDLTATANENGR